MPRDPVSKSDQGNRNPDHGVTDAATECRLLCAKILETFPLEVREEIYSHLIDRRPCEVLTLLLPPCHEDKRYLGEAVAKELAIYCYRNIEMSFESSALAEAKTWLEQRDNHGNLRKDYVLQANLTTASLYPVRTKYCHSHHDPEGDEVAIWPTFLQENNCPSLSLKEGATVILESFIPLWGYERSNYLDENYLEAWAS
ncbi:hypothetical protein M011DRAFT_507233 [Sporormia fimetaria CBS 119925]|uniref:Uncharacterized protein n=1 Tax=Sporormia fimetaria CBS 119925 TaxID=1340428 RepID=A0A6A6VMT0_9PLEO|nr:hypothetical protein M011DRAFT_507233 [Sporormia fimetaria CBS 119925]